MAVNSQKGINKFFTIDSIMGGWAISSHVYSKGQYDSSIGVDPDFPISGSPRTSGAIVPTVYEKFSGTNISGFPMWIMNNPKNSNTYVYATDGKVVSYDSNLANEALIGTPTSGAGNGAAYYNNYLYFATTTDISWYGPLNNSPTLTNNVWTGTTLGSQTALTNTTYPAFRGVTLPNHPMHVHTDNFLYFGDFVNGQGYVHKIRTSKTTNEGDTNFGSAYGALILPYGFYPVDIESYGTDVAVLAIQTISATINQGQAMIFLWNPLQATFYDQIPIQDPIATALFNLNGELFCFSGNAVNGVRVSTYTGGRSMNEEVYLEEGTPPFAGAVTGIGSKLNWGGWTAYPQTSASVFSYGSKKAKIPQVLHNIARSTTVGTTPVITALKYVQQADNQQPRLLIGAGTSSDKRIDRLSTSNTYNAVWRSGLVNIGNTFFMRSLRIPLGQNITAGVTITPVLYFDDSQTVISSLVPINSTNFSGNYVIYKTPDLSTATGENNFYLELQFSGTVACPVSFPIEFNIEIQKDES